jgi:hypothetical protein
MDVLDTQTVYEVVDNEDSTYTTRSKVVERWQQLHSSQRRHSDEFYGKERGRARKSFAQWSDRCCSKVDVSQTLLIRFAPNQGFEDKTFAHKYLRPYNT